MKSENARQCTTRWWLVALLILPLTGAPTAFADTPGTFTATGSMGTTRYFHTSTLLPNGRVLVAGGQSDGNFGFGSSVFASAELYDPGTGSFATTGSMNAARWGHTATRLGHGKVLLTGGAPTTATTELYDPDSGSFALSGSMSIPRLYHTATLLPNGKVLITGGFYSVGGAQTAADLYDPNTGTVTPTGPMIEGRYSHSATLLPNGKVLVVGGSSNTAPLISAELYDPATGTFSPADSLNTPRLSHSAILLPNRKVLVAGGYIGIDPASGVLASAELYDPATDSFTSTGSLGTARQGQIAALLPSGKVLFAGGGGGTGRFPLSSVELFDPSSGTFTATGSMETARFVHTITLLPNGKVLIAGGYGATGALASAELYCPEMPGTPGTWTPTGAMSTPRNQHTETILPNGKVLIAGGSPDNATFISSAELYDPSTATFTPTGSMGTARAVHTATLLPNGKVLVAGGSIGGNNLGTASAELYDPATGTWTLTGSLGTGRSFHTATLLPNGKVLIAGGFSDGTFFASAELYDPATGTFTPTGSLGTARAQPSAVLLPSGKVLITGGFAGVHLSSAELYDPATGTFAPTGSMVTSRSGGQNATLLPNGKVLIAGGNSSSGLLASAELYNPVTGTFTATGSMGTVRGAPGMQLLASGKVLVTGGFGSNFVSLASAELYDPAMETFTPTGSMGRARSINSQPGTITLLPNGQVLVAGGFSFDGIQVSIVNSPELYSTAICAAAANQPPTANAGPDQTVQCTSPSATNVMLDGTGSHDPDDDTLTYTWTGPFGMASGPTPTIALPLGTSTVTLVVNDGQADSEPDTVAITVVVQPVGLQPPLASLVPVGQPVPLPSHAFKQRRTLPLKLQLFCGTTALTDSDVAAPQIAALTRSGDAIDLETVDIDAGSANDNSLLFRFSDGNWIYNLSSAGLSAGTYTVTIQMPDGRLFDAGFVLR